MMRVNRRCLHAQLHQAMAATLTPRLLSAAAVALLHSFPTTPTPTPTPAAAMVVPITRARGIGSASAVSPATRPQRLPTQAPSQQPQPQQQQQHASKRRQRTNRSDVQASDRERRPSQRLPIRGVYRSEGRSGTVRSKPGGPRRPYPRRI